MTQEAPRPRRRFNADTPLDRATRDRVAKLKQSDSAARAYFSNVRDEQLKHHPPRSEGEHTPAQRASATQMANKAVAIKFLDWP